MLKSRFPRGAFARSLLCAALALAPEGFGRATASAEDAPSGFEALFAPLSQGACVKMDDVRALGAVVQLTPDQFQFVRAFWMAIPPVSQTLPPGDKAFSARDPDGATVFGLYDEGGQTCAVFRATDWMEEIIDQIGRGEVGKRGDPS